MSSQKKETRAIKWAISSAVFGTILKFIVGISSGSMSMISSAIDSLGDLIVSVLNLFIVKTSNKEADDDHNYGHSKVEGFGAMFEGGFIFAAGIFIIYESIHNLILKTEVHDNFIGLIAMAVITVITFFTVTYLTKIAKETGSLVIKSDSLHYRTDLYVNIGVFISLLLVKITGLSQIDAIVSIGIALYMIYSSTHIIIEGFDILMDKALCKEEQKKLKEIMNSYTGKQIESYHELKSRRGKIKHVEVHITMKGTATVKNLHDTMILILNKIREELGENTKVYIHPDYISDGEKVNIYE